jgi:iron complex outermembrane receptor protein
LLVRVGQPNDGLRVGGDWRRARFGVTLDVARYGEFCSFTQNPADDQTYPAKWLTGIEASFRPAGHTAAVGAQNLFNVFPGRNATVNSFNGIQTFPSHSPFGRNPATTAKEFRHFFPSR